MKAIKLFIFISALLSACSAAAITPTTATPKSTSTATFVVITTTPTQIEPTPTKEMEEPSPTPTTEPTSTPTQEPTSTPEPTPTSEVAQDWENIAGIGFDNVPRSWRWELNGENTPVEDGKMIVFAAVPKYKLAVVEKTQITPEITRFVFGFLSSGEKVEVQVDSIACEIKLPDGGVGNSGIIERVEVGERAAIWLFGLEVEVNVDELIGWSEECKDVWRELKPDGNLKNGLTDLFSKGLIPEGWQGEDDRVDLTDKVTLISVKGQ